MWEVAEDLQVHNALVCPFISPDKYPLVFDEILLQQGAGHNEREAPAFNLWWLVRLMDFEPAQAQPL